jgi:hypothetical protein
MNPLQKYIDQELIEAQSLLAERRTLREWAEVLNLPDPETSGVKYYISLVGLTYANLSVATHADALALMKHLALGKWERNVQPERTVYSTKIQLPHKRSCYYCQGDDWFFTIEIVMTGVPSSCRVVEETVKVPEQVIPATTKKAYRVVCGEKEDGE